MSKKLKIYLAGPDVFRENAVEHGKELKAKLKEFKMKGLYPFDNEVDNQLKGVELPLAIYKANIKMIKKCDAVLANLDFFRGPSCDVGTAFEIGYARALGKPVLGYFSECTNVVYRAKVKTYYDNSTFDDKTLYKNIEDFELPDNLMICLGCNGVYDELDAAINALRVMKGLK